MSELALYFNYNASQNQWLELAPGLISWVTQDTYLGYYRNYVEMDIDDTFTPDDAWDTTDHTIDYADADSLRMNPDDVTYAAQWSQANDFRMDQLFNYGSSIAAQQGDLEYAGSTTDSGTAGPDPLTAAFQATDPVTGKPYTDDFGWISHTYDTPYLDVGCATTNYIEAELNENTSSIAASGSGGTGGLGLAESTDTSLSYGYEDPQVFVPGNHSGFADLVPGNPGTVDPPDLDSSGAADTTGGVLAGGTYEYAVTDQFNGSDSPSTDQSSAFVTAPITVSGSDNSVTLTWESICHAANYLVYRASGPDYTNWSLVGSLATPASATLPDNSSVTRRRRPTSPVAASWSRPIPTPARPAPPSPLAGPRRCRRTPKSCRGSRTHTSLLPWRRSGSPQWATTPPSHTRARPTTSSASASATPAPPPRPRDIVDGTSQVVPRHPINIYYNASNWPRAQRVQHPVRHPGGDPGVGECDPSTTTCLTTPATRGLRRLESQMYHVLTTTPSRLRAPDRPARPAARGPATPHAAGHADTTGDDLMNSV